MTNNIDQLKTEVNEIKNSLDDLKNKVTTLSEEEKKNKAEALKTQAESTKQKIQAEIDALKDKTDDESKKEKEEAETLLNSFNETMSLYASILNPTESKPSSGTEEKKDEKQDEEKGIFTKSKEWVGEQWNDVWDTEKWKTEGGKNLLRTAGFIGTGVGAVALAYKGVKKLRNRAFGDKKEEEKKSEESESKSEKKKDDGESFWDGTVGKTIKTVGSVLAVGSVGYYVTHGLYTKNRGLNDLWDRERGKKLEFDAALEYSKGAVANQDDKEGMSYGMDLKYHEDTGEIEAYGERVKIDKDKRKIPGVGLKDVEFKKYEHMINAAIVIAYLKKNYSGKCVNNNPFYLTGDWKGNINVNTSEGDETGLNGTGNGGRIVGVTAGGLAGIVTGIFGGLKAGAAVTTVGGVVGYMAGSAYDHDNIMNDHMPELDNEFGKKNLGAYLNSMDCWQAKNQTENDVTESPIKPEIVEVMKTIQDTNKDLAPRGGRRQLDAIQDPNDEKKYTIKAYGRDFSAEVSGDEGNRKIRILGISGGKPNIKTNMEKSGFSNLEFPLKEGCYMSCLIGFLLDNYHHKGNKYPRFYFGSRVGIRSGLYFNDAKWYEVDNIDEYAVTANKLKERMPTLFQGENGKKFLEFLNDGIMDGDTDLSVWKKMD